MNLINRRQFIAITAASCASLKGLAEETPYTAALTVHPEKPLGSVPKDFAGLSYELLELADPGSFSPHNHELIEQFRFISPNGVLRLGGNTSDVGWFRFTPQTETPAMRTRKVVGEPSSE